MAMQAGAVPLRESPFHSRTSAICESWEWRGWAGYLAASSYQTVPEMEYYAIRFSAGLLDVSPLYKYRIKGKDALALMNKVVTRDMRKCRPGQIYYTPWCDDEGKTVDDGTAWNLGDGTFFMTAADPNLKWLWDSGVSLDIEIDDVSEEIAALALQGPSSREILNEATDGAVDKLKFYRFKEGKVGKVKARISRTGYTGDLGYEIWVDRDDAEDLWDALMAVGRSYRITPAGMLALDIARIEAGLILIEVDYTSSRKAIIEAQKYSPYELSLDWTVDLEKGPFVGRQALIEENRRGPRRRIVGLEVNWRAAEQFYLERGLPPEPPLHPHRGMIPVYSGSSQVGRATSSVWSPTLKKYIAMGIVSSRYSQLGAILDFEITVEGERRKAPATVVKKPFLDLERKKA